MLCDEQRIGREEDRRESKRETFVSMVVASERVSSCRCRSFLALDKVIMGPSQGRSFLKKESVK